MAKYSGNPKLLGFLRTDWIDAERGHIREWWTSPGRIRFLADAAENIRVTKSKIQPSWAFASSREESTLQLKVWICARDLSTDEVLDLDVVFGHKVYRVLFLPDAT
jgi:hypothetical protein